LAVAARQWDHAIHDLLCSGDRYASLLPLATLYVMQQHLIAAADWCYGEMVLM
jgi:hypothetical protein